MSGEVLGLLVIVGVLAAAAIALFFTEMDVERMQIHIVHLQQNSNTHERLFKAAEADLKDHMRQLKGLQERLEKLEVEHSKKAAKPRKRKAKK